MQKCDNWIASSSSSGRQDAVAGDDASQPYFLQKDVQPFDHVIDDCIDRKDPKTKSYTITPGYARYQELRGPSINIDVMLAEAIILQFQTPTEHDDECVTPKLLKRVRNNRGHIRYQRAEPSDLCFGIYLQDDIIENEPHSHIINHPRLPTEGQNFYKQVRGTERTASYQKALNVFHQFQVYDTKKNVQRYLYKRYIGYGGRWYCRRASVDDIVTNIANSKTTTSKNMKSNSKAISSSGNVNAIEKSVVVSFSDDEDDINFDDFLPLIRNTSIGNDTHFHHHRRHGPPDPFAPDSNHSNASMQMSNGSSIGTFDLLMGEQSDSSNEMSTGTVNAIGGGDYRPPETATLRQIVKIYKAKLENLEANSQRDNSRHECQSFREFLNTCLAFNFADQILDDGSSEHLACEQITMIITTWFLRIKQTSTRDSEDTTSEQMILGTSTYHQSRRACDGTADAVKQDQLSNNTFHLSKFFRKERRGNGGGRRNERRGAHYDEVMTVETKATRVSNTSSSVPSLSSSTTYSSSSSSGMGASSTSTKSRQRLQHHRLESMRESDYVSKGE